MRVSGGAEWRQFDTGRTDVFTPYVKLSGIYNLPERTYMMIEISRQQFASLFNGSYYTQTGGHLSLRKYLTNRLSLLVDLSCYDFNYSSTAINGKTSSVTDYYAIQIGSSAKLYKNIYCELYYQYSGNNLFHNGAPATCNHIAINLGLKL